MQTPHPPDGFEPAECFTWPQRVIVVGASARAAAASARNAGYQVAAVDRFGDADLRANVTAWRRWGTDRPLHEPLSEILADQPAAPTAVVLAGGTEAHAEQLVAAAQRLRSPFVRFLMPGLAQFDAAQDPACLRGIAARGGVSFPPSRPLPPADARSSDGEPLRGRWLSKRRGSCGGLGVGDWLPQAAQDYTQAVRPTAPSRAAGYLQQHVAGMLLGASYCGGAAQTRLLGVCRGRIAGGPVAPFRYAGSIGPLTLEQDLEKRLQVLGEAVRDELGLRGLFGVDLICSAGSLYLLEINPRYCASMELLEAAGPSCVAMHLQAFLDGDRIQSPAAEPASAEACRATGSQPKRVLCKRIVYARSPQRWDERCDALLSRFLEQRRDDESLRGVGDLPAIDTDIPAGAPILSILTRGVTPRDAHRQALQHERHLRASLQRTI